MSKVTPGQSPILIYQTEDDKTRLEVTLREETAWLTQKQMADLFQKDVRTVNEHIQNVFQEGELAQGATIRKFRIVQKEGARRWPKRLRRASIRSSKRSKPL